MIKAIIIDDELQARELLAGKLNLYCKNISLVGYAENVKSGIEAIKEHSPDLVFLDIDMPDGTGFDLLKKLDKEIDFKVIFITAFQEHAIKAFKFSAIDYLLKPVDTNELITAIEKAENQTIEDNIKLKQEAFIFNIENFSKEPKKLILKMMDDIYLIDMKDIVRCQSSENYTKFFLKDGRVLLTSKTLKDFEELLGEYGFIRVHQSHLINMNFFEHFDKKSGGFIAMKDGTLIPVSSRKKNILLDMLKNL